MTEESSCGCGAYLTKIEGARNGKGSRLTLIYSPSYDMMRYYGDQPYEKKEYYEYKMDAEDAAEEHIGACNCRGIA